METYSPWKPKGIPMETEGIPDVESPWNPDGILMGNCQIVQKLTKLKKIWEINQAKPVITTRSRAWQRGRIQN